MISPFTHLVFKKSIKCVLYAAFGCIELLLFMSCGLSNKDDARLTAPDTIMGEKSNRNLQNETRTMLPYLLPIDSLWAYYNVAWTTSGRCNKPDIFDDDSSKNLLYGFYVVLDHRSGRTSNVADIVVSYRENTSWGSSDTTQKIRVIHVKDSLFALPIAPFHVGDHIRCIYDKAMLKKGNYYCYSGEKYCYVVESCQDTIQQFYVFPADLACDWPRVLKYVETH